MPKAGCVVDLDFKSLSAEQENSLRSILKNLNYLKEGSRYNLTDSVVLSVTRELVFEYASLVNATERAKKQQLQSGE
jgi:hypothetical protein